MVNEDEIKRLAYGIWEREGHPPGKDKDHYFLAKDILEKQEVTQALLALSTNIGDIHTMLQYGERTTWYHFRFNVAIALMAVGAAFSLLTPPILIGGLNSTIAGGVLTLLSVLLIVLSEAQYQPNRYRSRWIKAAARIMIIGALIVPATAIVAHYAKINTFWISCIELGGIFTFMIGLYVAIFSRRQVHTAG